MRKLYKKLNSVRQTIEAYGLCACLCACQPSSLYDRNSNNNFGINSKQS